MDFNNFVFPIPTSSYTKNDFKEHKKLDSWTKESKVTACIYTKIIFCMAA